ncbi:MAG: hypothetical protein PHE17_19500 [Thiothrix sp.]|uniref:hypothetical protein n=1 Tax=Thiothrix sp. TaxID=1032 RepID=UPI002635F939|nr:hypothetical protein [Thiothrix sp.]MDD5395214.1 hypothetical protein [Thiothrix sp.]
MRHNVKQIIISFDRWMRKRVYGNAHGVQAGAYDARLLELAEDYAMDIEEPDMHGFGDFVPRPEYRLSR